MSSMSGRFRGAQVGVGVVQRVAFVNGAAMHPIIACRKINDAEARRAQGGIAAAQGPAGTSGDVAAILVEAVLLRVMYARVELEETRRFGDHLAAIVSDTAPHPLPWRVGFLNP